MVKKKVLENKKGGKQALKQKGPKGNIPQLMGRPGPDRFQGGMPPWMRGPFPDEMWGPEGDMPPWIMDQYSDEMWGPEGNMPPSMRDRYSDEMWGPEGDMPPWMRDRYSNEMWGPEGDMPPSMRDRYSDEMWGPDGDMPPWMRDRYSNDMWGPEGDMPPWMMDEMWGHDRDGPADMGGPFPGPFGGPMAPGMRGPFPGPRFRGPMPPEEGGSFPGPRFRGSMRPGVRGRFPGPGSEGPMSPGVRGRFPGPGSEGPMPPGVRGRFPGPGSEGPMPPGVRGRFPGPRSKRSMPTKIGDHFPGPGSEGPMPPEMRDSFPGPRSEGPMPPEMRDSFPGPRSEGPMPPEMRGPFSGPRCGEPLSPQMRAPYPREMSERRGPSQNEMCEPGRNVPPWAGGSNAPDPPPCGPWPEAGVNNRRPGPSPAVKQMELEKYGPAHGENYSFPSGSHSSDHRASRQVAECAANANDHYLQESAGKILESFGLSNEDLEELSSYPEDQLKPENMPEILKRIQMKKMARHRPGLPSQEAVGGDGFCSPLATQMPMPPESWRMNYPTPSMITDYCGSSPRLFPHTCVLCKIECKQLRDWLLHLETPAHLESCRQLRQQSANQAQSQWSVSSSPGHSSSGQARRLSRSRSRSPLLRREKPHGKPKNEAVSREPPKADPQPVALNSLVEKSVSQAMSVLQQQPGGAGLAVPPSLQLDPAALSLGLVSMMQLVATQVVQAAISSKQATSEQAGPGAAAGLVPVRPSTSARGGTTAKKPKAAAAKTAPPAAGGVRQRMPKRVLICGHGLVAQANWRAEASPCGSDLGLCSSAATIEWLGQLGLSWEQLLPTLAVHLEASPLPDILVLHLGEEDLWKETSIALSLRIRKDLACIREKVPGVAILWSFLLERAACPEGEDLQRYLRARAKVNEEVRRAVEAAGGACILHSNIKGSSRHLYQWDGVRLSDAGCDLFLRNLKQGLVEFIRSKDW